MKKVMVIAVLIAASLVTKAQQVQRQQAPKDTDLIIKIKGSQLLKLQAVLKFSHEALSTSRSPSVDVQDVKAAIEEVFPALIPDTAKAKPKPEKPATTK